MHKSNDFILMDVMNIDGKKLGCISDILVDFNEGYVIGFLITQNKLFRKDISVLCDNIVSFNENMVIRQPTWEKKLKFSEFKGMDVIDKEGNLLGMVEDIFFNNYDFKIKGVVVSSGVIRNFVYGKDIYLINKLILGEQNILYFNKNKKISFVTMPHELLEVNKNEKEI